MAKGRTVTGKFTTGNPGRKKGSLNKTTLTVKEAIVQAFDELGGADYLKRLAVECPQAFATLVGKCVPEEHNVRITSLVEAISLISDYERPAITGNGKRLEEPIRLARAPDA